MLPSRWVVKGCYLEPTDGNSVGGNAFLHDQWRNRAFLHITKRGYGTNYMSLLTAWRVLQARFQYADGWSSSVAVQDVTSPLPEIRA